MNVIELEISRYILETKKKIPARSLFATHLACVAGGIVSMRD